MPEREVQHDPQVLEGEDEAFHEPAAKLDPYTPEPGPTPGDERAFRLLWLVIAALAIIVIVIVVAALL